MPRVTHVKAAQQRYRTVPVIDPETGVQKRVPVMARNGQPKKTKTGREITRRVTKEDRDQPLGPRSCDYPGCTISDGKIEVGQSYKWIKPKSGPYGGTQRNRHAEHPSWQQWEYSSSLSARIAQIEHSFTLDGVTTEDEVQAALDDVAQQIRDLADEKKEAAQNMEDGFGHATYQSEELEQQGDDLESWADDIEQVDIPSPPEPEEDDCFECSGTGQVDNPDFDPDDEESTEDEEIECDECNGTGQTTPDEPTDEQIADWLEEVDQAVQDVLGNCPV